MNSLDAEKQGELGKWRLRHTLASIFAVAVLFNYPWEFAQSPLYVGMDSPSTVWGHCLLASLGDGLLVLLIFAIGWVALGRPFWFERPGIRGYVLMLAAGFVISVSVEWFASRIAGVWTYTVQMPLVSGLGVGIAPVAQMLVLPPVIFRVVTACHHRAGQIRTTMENTREG